MSGDGIEITRRIDLIVVHHSATPRGRNVKIDEIRQWHLDRGFNDIGYHDVIQIDGSIRAGRDRNKAGAHCAGHNRRSIGICIVGMGSQGFEDAQWSALRALLNFYRERFPKIPILGHRDLAKTKCPEFDVQTWVKQNVKET